MEVNVYRWCSENAGHKSIYRVNVGEWARVETGCPYCFLYGYTPGFMVERREEWYRAIPTLLFPNYREFVRWLRSQSSDVEFKRRSTAECPVARWLQRVTGEFVNVGRDWISIPSTFETYFHSPVPRWVTEYVETFDEGPTTRVHKRAAVTALRGVKSTN